MEHSFFQNTGNTTAPPSPSYGAITQNLCHYRGLFVSRRERKFWLLLHKFLLRLSPYLLKNKSNIC